MKGAQSKLAMQRTIWFFPYWWSNLTLESPFEIATDCVYERIRKNNTHDVISPCVIKVAEQLSIP